jgi:hypothetical protein
VDAVNPGFYGLNSHDDAMGDVLWRRVIAIRPIWPTNFVISPGSHQAPTWRARRPAAHSSIDSLKLRSSHSYKTTPQAV